MKFRLALFLVIAMVLVSAEIVSAQDPQEANDPNQTLSNLQTQLSGLQDHEANLKIRLQELEFELRPENIERTFSGVGSTHPEELRENRRLQLQTEKDRIVTQLNQIGSDRSRLESAVASAQAQVYQSSAVGSQSLRRGQNASPAIVTFGRVLVGIAGLVIALGGLVLFVVIRRQRRLEQ